MPLNKEAPQSRLLTAGGSHYRFCLEPIDSSMEDFSMEKQSPKLGGEGECSPNGLSLRWGWAYLMLGERLLFYEEMRLPEMPSCSKSEIGKHRVWLAFFCSVEGSKTQAAVLFLQSWGPEPTRLLLLLKMFLSFYLVLLYPFLGL